MLFSQVGLCAGPFVGVYLGIIPLDRMFHFIKLIVNFDILNKTNVSIYFLNSNFAKQIIYYLKVKTLTKSNSSNDK